VKTAPALHIQSEEQGNSGGSPDHEQKR
jgi:hypothetical protein